MAYEHLALARHDDIATLTIGLGSPRNSLPWAFWAELTDVMKELDRDGSIRVAVIQSSGPHFSAGMDFGFFSCSVPPPAMEQGRYREALHNCIIHLQAAVDSLESVRFPVLVGVQGGCIGGALDLVCGATLRYATEDAFFQAAEVLVGLSPDMGSVQRLPQLLPAGVAADLLITGRRYGSSEAVRDGFVVGTYQTVDALHDGLAEAAALIAKRSPLAVTGIKRGLLLTRDHGVRAGLAHIAAWNAAMFVSDDIAESLEARRVGREPAYRPLAPFKADALFAAARPQGNSMGEPAT